MHVIKEPKEWQFDKIGHRGKIFPTADLTDKVQFVVMESDDHLEVSLIQHTCDYSYYVLEGEGSFIINDQEETCSKGDLVVIPAGNKYTFKGKLKLLLVSTPPWSPEQQEEV